MDCKYLKPKSGMPHEVECGLGIIERCEACPLLAAEKRLALVVRERAIAMLALNIIRFDLPRGLTMVDLIEQAMAQAGSYAKGREEVEAVPEVPEALSLRDRLAVVVGDLAEARELVTELQARGTELVEARRAAEARADRLQEALTPSAETKAEYMSEFQFPLHGGTATVPWTTIKEIMAAIRNRAARCGEES